MSTTRFNADPDADYGKCQTCGVSLPTQEDSNAHGLAVLKEPTLDGEKAAHTISVLNPTRERRISSAIGNIISDALEEAMDEIDRLLDKDHVNHQEIETALQGYPDFAEAWEDRDE